MKKVFFHATAIVFTAVVLLIGCAKRDYSGYMKMKDPSIAELPSQKVITVETAGAPEKTGAPAMKALFGVYYQLKWKVKGMGQADLRARWTWDENGKPDTMKGTWAIPVPDSVTELPKQKPENPQVKLDTWQYGTVAWILHTGSYDTETEDIARLKKFITDSGDEIAGMHEETYIKGPGMFGKGDPNKYLTIISYPVKKATAGKSRKK